MKGTPEVAGGVGVGPDPIAAAPHEEPVGVEGLTAETPGAGAAG